MKSTDNLTRRFQYHYWAISQYLNVLGDDEVHAKARGLLGHALAADQIWLGRIQGADVGGAVLFPEPSARELHSLLEKDRAGYEVHLGGATPSTVIAYRTTSGVECENTLGDILYHVLLHGMYHRGQVAMTLRAAGESPPSTDFIKWARERPNDALV